MRRTGSWGRPRRTRRQRGPSRPRRGAGACTERRGEARRGSRAATRAALFEAATSTLVRILANGADGSLPVHDLVVERTDEERNDLAVWHAQRDSNELLEEVAAKLESAVAAAAAASRFVEESDRKEAARFAKMNAPKQI
jgi:hypothetical protein